MGTIKIRVPYVENTTILPSNRLCLTAWIGCPRCDYARSLQREDVPPNYTDAKRTFAEMKRRLHQALIKHMLKRHGLPPLGASDAQGFQPPA